MTAMPLSGKEEVGGSRGDRRWPEVLLASGPLIPSDISLSLSSGAHSCWLRAGLCWAPLPASPRLRSLLSRLPLPEGRDIPTWLEGAELLLAIAMIPACALIPVPLLAFARRLRRGPVRVSRSWVAAWVVVTSSGAAVEGLFVWRLVRFIAAPFANLPAPSWHALYFGMGYLLTGTAMMLTLAGVSRSARRTARDS